jgi:glycosyltransferase involved in cell wall biosynthesis
VLREVRGKELVKVAYILSLFPKISETFILREMQALRGRGIEIQIVSLKRRREPITHPEALTFLDATVYGGSPARAFSALARLAARRPGAVAAAVGKIVATHAGHPLLLPKALPLVATAAEAGEILAARGVDRVHAHWATYPAQVAWLVKRFSGIPYSLTAHAHDIFLPNPLLREKILESDFTVTISRFNRDFIEGRCGEAAARKLEVLHCGIPLAEYPFAPDRPEQSPRLVSIGRLVDYKGFPILLRAVAALRERGREVSCEIVGDGPLLGRLREEVATLGLNGAVSLEGARTLAQVRESLRGATACVLASQRGHDGQMDGIPVVLMEAMALGVPVVSTRISGIPEIIEDGRTGLLVEPEDPESLAGAVERLLGDPALASRLATEGRKKVESEFDIERCAERLLSSMRRGAREGRTASAER